MSSCINLFFFNFFKNVWYLHMHDPSLNHLNDSLFKCCCGYMYASLLTPFQYFLSLLLSLSGFQKKIVKLG